MPSGGLNPRREPGGNTGSAAKSGSAANDGEPNKAKRMRPNRTRGIFMNRLKHVPVESGSISLDAFPSPHPEERSKGSRLEGRGRATRCLRPSFETAASPPPQDEVRV